MQKTCMFCLFRRHCRPPSVPLKFGVIEVMKKWYALAVCVVAVGSLTAISIPSPSSTANAEEPAAAQKPSKAAIERARKTTHMLDNVYKQTIVLVTDKYVHDEDDFPAGSAAVLLFKNISKSGSHQVRLIDATGEPYEPTNVAQDEFEKTGVKQLKAGAESHEKVVNKEGKPYLRTLTPVPVVMEKCIMCHAHYADAKPGEPIGAISYTLPIE